MALTRRDFTKYGITLKNWKSDLIFAMSCYLPIAIGGALLGFLDSTRWDGALILVVVQIVVLFAAARMLSKKLDPSNGIMTIVLASAIFATLSIWKGLFPGVGSAISSFIYYLFFVGFGEEIMYRGYIQSRLNEVFERPWTFYGVKWGWSVLITSLLFGWLHVLNGIDPVARTFIPQWWWGLWTIFGGLVFSYIREKSGSVVPGAILHAGLFLPGILVGNKRGRSVELNL